MLAFSATSLSPTTTPAARTIAVPAAADSMPPYCEEQNSNTRESYLSRLMIKFEESLDSLGIQKKGDDYTAKLESMSNFIYESMSVGSRNYHSVQHVFNLIDGHVCGDLDAIAVLAALFHDCVYSSVDGGLSTLQRKKLDGAINEEQSSSATSGTTVLRTHPDSMKDPLLRMVLTVFGLEANQVLTGADGDNEFLSAVIAVRELRSLVCLKILTEIAVCIEATIPFRTTDDSGATALDRLYSKLEKANVDLSPVEQLSETECVQAVQRAAMVANEDVGNFGTTDHAFFLDNTWSLLPESNVPLRSEDQYTVDQFLFAVFKMHGFFSFLKPDMVFQQFRGVPSTEIIERVTENAARNLQVGGKYVSAKLVSVSVLAAFAALTGGDAPIRMFMGYLPSPDSDTRRLEDTLLDGKKSSPPIGSIVDCDPVVYQLLAEGRSQHTFFDIKRSPVAAYLYPFIGDSGFKRILDQFEVSKMTPETATSLLRALPRDAVSHIAKSLSEVAVSRKYQILSVLKTLPDENQDET